MPAPPRPSSRRRKRIAGEPPPGLFPAGDDLLRILAVLSIAAAAATVCSLLNRRPQPFCDSLQLQSLDATDYDDGYDSCEPCPQNGRCVDGELECIHGFKRYGRTCVEDGLLSQTANKISQLLQRRICVQHARALCGKPAKTLFQMHDISTIVDELLSKNSVGLTEDGIKLVKVRVVESLQDLLDTSSTFDKISHAHDLSNPSMDLQKYYICDDLLYPALLWMLWNIYHKHALSNRAEQIYQQVCEILEDNAINGKIGNSECDPSVVASWLRDHLLVPRERKNAFLWKKVEELILEDSRIDQYPKVVKGESKVVYEWQASGSLSAKLKKGARCKSQTGTGTIKVAEELGGCVGEVREHGSCDLMRKDKTNA